MDPQQIIGQLIGSFLGGKQKRRRGGFGLPGLDAGRGSGLLNAGTILTVGGLIWGAIETMQQSSGAGPTGTTPPQTPGATPPAGPPRGAMSADLPGLAAPPPPLPPIPGSSAPPAQASAVPVASAALLPLVQLAISAASADGEMSDDEVAVIRARAGELGAAALVDAELRARRPLDTITPGFTTTDQRQIAYALAYAVVHGQAAVSAGERMYLTQLQRLLALSHDDVERIERETLAGASD